MTDDIKGLELDVRHAVVMLQQAVRQKEQADRAHHEAEIAVANAIDALARSARRSPQAKEKDK
jgi:hypothetical protein